MTLLFLFGCNDAPPPPSRRDTGPRPGVDSGPFIPFDAGNTRPTGRPDGGPRLPDVDVEVVLPYFGDSHDEPLEIEGEVGTLDVFFSIDTTGSFGGEIDNLQADLRTRILPELRSRVDNVSIGVGRFEDFPTTPFGSETDRPFRLLTAVTDSEAAVASAVASLDQPLGNGADIPEAGAEALYQIATGEGFLSFVPPFTGATLPGGGNLGGVGFRGDALRVVVQVSDAPSHVPADYAEVYPTAHSMDQAIEAMNDLGIRALGVASGPEGRQDLEAAAIGTGAVLPPVGGSCQTGIGGSSRPPVGGVCPLVFDIEADGTGLAGALVDAITDVLSIVAYDEVWGESDDGLGFVQAIEATEAVAPPGIAAPTLEDRRPMGDGFQDTFDTVGPGTVVRFRAILRNETIPPADYDQYFNLTLRVVGDGVTLVTRRLRIVVPRGRIDAGVPDATADSGTDSGTDVGVDAGPIDAG